MMPASDTPPGIGHKKKGDVSPFNVSTGSPRSSDILQ